MNIYIYIHIYTQPWTWSQRGRAIVVQYPRMEYHSQTQPDDSLGFVLRAKVASHRHVFWNFHASEKPCIHQLPIIFWHCLTLRPIRMVFLNGFPQSNHQKGWEQIGGPSLHLTEPLESPGTPVSPASLSKTFREVLGHWLFNRLCRFLRNRVSL